MIPRGTEGGRPSVPLRLDLLRHGEALPAGPDGDSARRLSAAGRDSIARLAARFAREGWRPATVLASPLARAQESAAILVAGAAPGLEIETLETLAPEHDPEDVVAELTSRVAHGHVVLVGHQPLLGRLVAHLASGREGGLPAGGLVRLEFQGDIGRGGATVAVELRPEGA